MGKNLFNSSNCTSGCSSKYIQGIELSSVSTIQSTEVQSIFNITQNTGNVTTNIGDYIDQIRDIIILIATDQLSQINLGSGINIGSGSLNIQNNVISSTTNIIFNPTSSVIINGGLQVSGAYANFTTDLFTTKARVPIIGYENLVNGSLIPNDGLDRGIAFNWPQQLSNISPITKQTGFFGLNNESGRFVIWNQTTNISPNNYQRSTVQPFGVEIDALYTNIISSENITGSGNSSLLIKSGLTGNSSLDIYAGTETHVINNGTFNSVNMTFNISNIETHTVGKYILSETTNVIDNTIVFDSLKTSISHNLDIIGKTKIGNITLDAGDTLILKSKNNSTFTSTLGQMTFDIATNYLLSTTNGYASFIVKQSSFFPPTTLNPSPISGDFDVKAYSKITMQSNGLIALKTINNISFDGALISNIAADISLRASVSIFEEADDGIYLISGSNHTITSLPQGSILINAGYDNPSISANNIVMNSGNDIFATSTNNYIINSEQGVGRIENSAIGKSMNVRSLNGPIYIGTDNTLPSLANGAIFIKTKLASIPSSTSNSINIVSEKLLNLRSDTSTLTVSALLSTISLTSGTGTSIINNSSGNISLRNISSGNINIISDNGGLIFVTQNSLPTISGGAILLCTKLITPVDPGINSISLLAANSVSMNSPVLNMNTSLLSIVSNGGISVINTFGNITINNVSNIRVISQSGTMYLGTNNLVPIIGSGSIIIATNQASPVGTNPNSILIEAYVKTILKSRDGCDILNTSTNPILIENSGTGNIIMSSSGGGSCLLSSDTLFVSPVLSAGNILIKSNNTRLTSYISGTNYISLLSANNVIIESENQGITIQSSSSFIPITLPLKSIVLNSNVNPSATNVVSNIPTSSGIIQLNSSLYTLINGILRVGTLKSCNGISNIIIDNAVSISSGNKILVNEINELTTNLLLKSNTYLEVRSGVPNTIYGNGSGTPVNGDIYINSSTAAGNKIELNSALVLVKTAIEFSSIISNPGINATNTIWISPVISSRLMKGTESSLIGTLFNQDRPFLINYELLLSVSNTESNSIKLNSVSLTTTSTSGPICYFSNYQGHIVRQSNTFITQDGNIIINDKFTYSNSSTIGEFFKIVDSGNFNYFTVKKSTSSNVSIDIGGINSQVATNNFGNGSWNNGSTKRIEFSPTGVLPTFSGNVLTTSGLNICYFDGNVNISGSITGNELLMKNSGLSIIPPNDTSINQGVYFIKSENVGSGSGLFGYTRPIFRDYNSSGSTSHYFLLMSSAAVLSTSTPGQIPYYNHSISQDFVLSNTPSSTGQVLTNLGSGIIGWSTNTLQVVYNNSPSAIINVSQISGLANGIRIRNNSSSTALSELFKISNALGTTDYFSIIGQGDTINLSAGTSSDALNNFGIINLTAGVTSASGGAINMIAGNTNTKNGTITMVSHKTGITTPSNALIQGDIGITSANAISVMSTGITSITAKSIPFSFDRNISGVGVITINGNRIIRERLPAITALAPSGPTDNDIRVAVNLIISRMQDHGLIA